MTQSAAQAAAFFEETAAGHEVWTPFWSRRSRAERVISTVAAYRDFEAVAVALDAWRDRWLPGLQRDGILVGVNWSGQSATGYDIEPAQVMARLKE